jgi:hypothetical protein
MSLIYHTGRDRDADLRQPGYLLNFIFALYLFILILKKSRQGIFFLLFIPYWKGRGMLAAPLAAETLGQLRFRSSIFTKLKEYQ